MLWLDRLTRTLLLASAAALVWLLLHPPAEGLLGPPPTGGRPPPSLEPVAALAAQGKSAEAIHALAALVRAAPALADRRGPLDTHPVLRDLVLSRWKDALEGVADRDAALRDVRFLQRRLAGGCS